MRENDVQNSICEYLAYRKHCFWRQNTVGIYDASRKTYRSLPKYAMAGVADIIVIDNGHAIFLEVKTDKGRQSKNQKDFENYVTKHGATYAVVRSIEDVRALNL